MAEALISPGVFLRENDQSQVTAGPIAVGAALVGPTVLGPVNVPTVVTSYSQYKTYFGTTFLSGGTNFEYLTSLAAYNYFQQGGTSLLVTRVASGSYTSATSSILDGGVRATGSATLTAFADNSFFLLTGSKQGKFTLTSSLANLAETSTQFYLLTGSTAATTMTNIVNKINSVASAFQITAVSGSDGKLLLSASIGGTTGNNFKFVSGSVGTTTTLGGGTGPTNASFTLETLSVGQGMNNYTTISPLVNGILPSGSVSNVRWEIASADTTTGLFTLLIRRGDDYAGGKTVLETWSNLSLDPNQNNYIAYVIGDMSQTLLTDEFGDSYLQTTGNYPNKSNYVRVKSVAQPTPNYLSTNGQPVAGFVSAIPSVGSGSVEGAFGGASGPLFGCTTSTGTTTAALNMYQNIPTTTADTDAENIQGLYAANYDAAINLLKNKTDYRYNSIYAPGLNAQNGPSQISTLLTNTQDRGDAIAVVDVVGYNQSITTVTTNAQAYDNSYGATYWPWVEVRSPETGKLIYIPPSAIIPAVYEYNDKVSAEWFAPAGLNRGGLPTVIQPERKLTVGQRNLLYSGRVNPIATFPGVGTVVYGQKTLQARASALDRVNVRRLLIALKTYIGQIAETLVFEQNTNVTRNKFLSQVNPYLEYVQQRQGLYAFRVVMDDTNNTPDVIDRNILAGAIYLQPTKTAEFIQLDFNILPTGATFGQ